MIDASIYRDLRPMPEIDALGSYGKVLAIGGQMQNQRLTAERLKAEQLQNQATVKKQQDSEGLRRAYIAGGGDPDKTRQMALQNGVGPDAIDSFDKQIAEITSKHAETDAKTLDTKLKRNTAMLDVHDSALQAAQTNPQAFAQQWSAPGGFFDQASSIDPETAKHFDRNTPPTPDQIQMSRAAHVTQEYTLKQANIKKSAIEAAHTQGEESRATALAPGQLEKAGGEAAAQSFKNAAQTIGTVTDQASYEAWAAKQPASVLGNLPTKFSPDVVGKVQALAKTPVELEAERHNAVTEAGAEAQRKQTAKYEQARINLEGQKNTREQAIYEQTYGEGSNEALRGVEPKLRTAAVKDARKAADDYGKAVDSARAMNTVLKLAESGNKAAGSNLPLIGVETLNALNGIKRVNRADVDKYQGAGNILDRIQGKIGKLVTGQPIPADVLADVKMLHDTLAGNATKAYDDRLTSINQNYKSSFKPTPRQQEPASGWQATGYQKGHIYGGMEFLGGDPNKAENWKK